MFAISTCLALLGAVIVANPAAAEVPPPTLTLQTSGGIVRDDSVVSSGTSMTAAVGGLLTSGTGPRELRIDLDDATVYEAGGVTAPEGWTIEWSTDDGTTWVSTEPGTPGDVTNVRASASVTAGVINGTSQAYTKAVASPVPASAFSGSTGGDGWDVFFYDDYVLNIFHHQSAYVALDCHLRSTGARCDGYDPTATSGAAHSRFPDFMAASRSGGWVDGNTGKAYAFTADNRSGSPTRYAPGVLCIDLDDSPPTDCGFTALSTNTNISSYTPLGNAEGVGGRLFGLDAQNQDLLCFDPTTGAACASSPVELDGSNNPPFYHVYPLGSKVFASTDSTLYCFEASTLSSCGGAWPVTYSSLSWTATAMAPVAHMDTSGTIDGVCLWNGCLDLEGAEQTGWVNPHSITPWASNAGLNSYSGQYGKFTASAGRAYLQEVLHFSGTEVFCFDYATEAACAGFDTTPTSDQSLYALVPDPNNPACIWYNSDPGNIGLFDATTGANECSASPVITLQPSAFAPRFVCTTSGGIDRWTSLTLDSVSGSGTPASQALTVRTGNGDAVSGWVDIPITVGESLSLVDLPVSETGARPTFNIAFSGVTGGSLTSSDFTILYEGRGPELCVDYTVDNTSVSGSPNCPVVQSIAGTLTQDVSGSVSQSAPPRSFTASGSAIDCPENIIFAGPPGPVEALMAGGDTPLQATVTFEPPADDGGSPIRWYEISIDAGTTWTVVNETPDTDGVVTYVVSPLSAGSHDFEVRAVNVLGTSTIESVSTTVSSTTTTTQATTTTTSSTVPSTTTSTTAAPTTTTTVVPIQDGGGKLPDLDPGVSGVTDDGVQVDVEIDVMNGDTIEVSSSDGVVLGVSGECGGPCPVRTGSNGEPYLELEDTGQVRVQGEGFMPGSTVHVWILPESTYLGSVTVDANGRFNQLFDVDAAPGEHTLQVNGITAAGATRSANLGLAVSGGAGSGQLPDTGANLSFAYIGLGLLSAGAAVIGILRFSSIQTGKSEESIG